MNTRARTPPTSTPAPGERTVRVERAEPVGGAELDVTIIVPVQSKDAEVDDVVEALSAVLERERRSWECVLVFDGVRGEAWDRAQALAARLGPKLKIISFKNPFGDSVCLSAGVERALGRYIVTSPSYVQIDPVELVPMLARLDDGADMVTPWRKPRVDPPLNRLQSACFNWIIRQIIHGEFHDLNCYFRAMRRDVFDDLSIYGDLYRFLPVIAHRQGFQVVEVPVRHLREWGKAGFYGLGVYARRFLDILGVMFLTKFTLKPLRFFGSIGVLFSLLGGGVLAVLAYQKIFLNAGLYNRGVFLLGIMLFVLGVQIIGFGLVGEIIIFTQARNLREYRVERTWE